MMVSTHVSAGGAAEYSPERSAAELRDIVFSASNPCQGVTEFARLSLVSQPKTDSAATFRGLSPVCSISPEFPCVSLRALIRGARGRFEFPARADRARLRQVGC